MPRMRLVLHFVKAKKYFLLIPLTVITLFFAVKLAVFAGTTPPVTTNQFSGTIGSNGWYTSSVDVTLQTLDLESGPHSTTYWLNSNPPNTITYNTTQNQILNPSMEEVLRNGSWPFYWYSIRHWDNNDCSGCAVLFAQSQWPAKYDWRSAFTGILGSGTYYWYNRDRAVNIVPGQTYTVSVWVKTLDIMGAPGAWMEAWAKGAGDESTDLKIGETSKVTGTHDWTLLSYEFTAPADYSLFYVKLVLSDTNFLGAAWWDGVSMFGGTNFFTQFTVIENGSHHLYYYSSDNNSNVETTHDVPLKIDTVGPQDWDNFDATEGGNDHSFIGSVQTHDITSGIDVSETYYSYYTNHNDEEWDHNGDGETDWYPAASVTKVPSGQVVTDGYTGIVKITTPSVNFGDSATVMRFQFQTRDMAGNITNSPVLTIAGPWIQVTGQGEIYVKDGISMNSSPVEGVYNTDSIISVGNTTVDFFSSSCPYEVQNYSHQVSGALNEVFPNYNTIRANASPLPQNKLPTVSGIYYFNGNYSLDTNTITSGFESGILSTVVIIEGNLTIKKDFNINPSSSAVFLVTGSVGVEGLVQNISAYFVTGNQFNTNIDSQGKKQLIVKGGVSAQNGIILGRNLGRKGNPTNDTDPAEKFIFEPKYLFSTNLGDYLGNSSSGIIWDEEQ